VNRPRKVGGGQPHRAFPHARAAFRTAASTTTPSCASRRSGARKAKRRGSRIPRRARGTPGTSEPGHGTLVREITLGPRGFHVACAVLGLPEPRPCSRAECFAAHRVAYGAPIAKIPQVARTLARLKAEHESCLRSSTRAWPAWSARTRPGGFVPILKIELSRRASAAVREAQLLIGGHGILEDFSSCPAWPRTPWSTRYGKARTPSWPRARPRPCAAPRSWRLRASGRRPLRRVGPPRREEPRHVRRRAQSDNLELCGLAYETLVKTSRT